MAHRFLSSLLLALSLLLPGLAVGAVPTTLGFSARIADAGTPVTGTHSFTFTLWDVETGGAAGSNDPWTETQSLDVTGGVVTAVLGADTTTPNPLPIAAFDGRALFLEVSMDGTAFGPRMALHSVPYAFRAALADAVVGGGVTPSSLSGSASAAGQVPVADGAGAFSWMTPAPASHQHAGADVTSAVANATNAANATWASGAFGLACSGCVQSSEVESLEWTKLTGVPTSVANSSRTVHGVSMAGTKILTTCTNQVDGVVSITVPGPGVVRVEASANVYVNHISGVTDAAYFYIGTSPTDCVEVTGSSKVMVPAALPTTGGWGWTTSPRGVFAVLSAGTYSYYLNAQMGSGQDAGDSFDRSLLEATYFPQ